MDPGQVVVHGRIEEVLLGCGLAQLQALREAALHESQAQSIVGAELRVLRLERVGRAKVVERGRRPTRLELVDPALEVILRGFRCHHSQTSSGPCHGARRGGLPPPSARAVPNRSICN